MANISDITASAAINCLSALLFLMAFAILRLQPINDRVYFPKWYLKGIRENPSTSGPFVKKFINLDYRMYLRFLNWVPAALKMPEPELIEHAGLDSAVYIRIYLLGLKVFVPIAVLALSVLIPVNYTDRNFEIMSTKLSDLTFGEIDKFSISNVPPASKRLYVHITMAYVFTLWTCYMLYKEYKIVSDMRLHFLATEDRHPDQFTVLVRNMPQDPEETISENVEHFFRVNHPDQYLLHQVVYNANKLAKIVNQKKNLYNRLIYYTNKYERKHNKRPTTKSGFWGLWGKRIDAIDYYTEVIEKLRKEEVAERERVISDPKSVVPAAFVSFKSRWGAAVCAQTQQTRNPIHWLTTWAPQPRDVYWDNLAIPFIELNMRRLLIAAGVIGLTFFFMIPITFVQTLANIESIKKVVPFLKPVIDKGPFKSVIQGFLPGIVLKIFILFLPMIVMAMSKIEGFVAISTLEAKSAAKFHLFLIVNVFFGSLIAGTALEQIEEFLNQKPADIPKTIGVSIPMKATFFITYIMVDGWAGIAAEILRLIPLIVYHLKNLFLVKTEKDRDEAMDPGSLAWPTTEPRIQLYFLLGLVYAAVTPIFLPFIIVFFAFSYLVYRHQIINVYNQQYESAASFWPDVHRRIVVGLVISQFLLLGILTTKDAVNATPFLLVLPVLTFLFHRYCKNRFEPAFRRFPLQDAMIKDAPDGIRSVINFLKDKIPELKIKDLKVMKVDVEEVIEDGDTVNQLMQEDDEKTTSDKESEDETTDLDDPQPDRIVVGPNSDATDDAKSLDMKLFVGGVLHNREDTPSKDELVRVPAEIEEMEKDSFVLHVPIKSHDQDSEESIASKVKVAAIASQGVSELMPPDVAKALWSSDKVSRKVSRDVREIVKFAVNQAKKREKLSEYTNFSRITTSRGDLDPFDGLYVGAFGPYGTEVVQLRRKYGNWSGANDVEFFEYVEAVKVTGDLNVPAGQVTFRAKLAKGSHFSNRGMYPDELGVVASYKGQGRIAEFGFKNPKWVEGELLQLNGKGMGPYVKGADLGFLYVVPEQSFLVLFNRLRLPE